MNCKVSGDNPERVGKLLSDVEVVVVERYQAQPDNFLENISELSLTIFLIGLTAWCRMKAHRRPEDLESKLWGREDPCQDPAVLDHWGHDEERRQEHREDYCNTSCQYCPCPTSSPGESWGRDNTCLLQSVSPHTLHHLGKVSCWNSHDTQGLHTRSWHILNLKHKIISSKKKNISIITCSTLPVITAAHCLTEPEKYEYFIGN